MENPLVPVDEDINEIENNLYIGNLETACNADLLQKYKIKKILSVLQTAIGDKYKVEGIDYKYINIWDTENEDIISYFPECFDFIYRAQLANQNVLVHCRAGRSRSAAVVIGFLMKKFGFNVGNATRALSSLRSEISPNEGFQRQLQLWGKMQFVLCGSEPEYRLVLVSGLKSRLIVIARFAQTEIWTTCKDYIKSAFLCYLQKVINAEINSKTTDKGLSYQCSKCANKLFNEINVIKNSGSHPSCKSIYIEPQQWLLHEIIENAKNLQEVMVGKVICLKCQELLGTYDWRQNNTICECEAHKGLDYYLDIKIESNKVKH